MFPEDIYTCPLLSSHCNERFNNWSLSHGDVNLKQKLPVHVSLNKANVTPADSLIYVRDSLRCSFISSVIDFETWQYPL